GAGGTACGSAASLPRAPGLARSAALVSLRNANVLPSGDQAGDLAPPGRSVSCRASPPSSGSTNSWSPLPAWRTNASRRPSGDQRGAESRGPAVSGRGPAPAPAPAAPAPASVVASASTIHSAVS